MNNIDQRIVEMQFDNKQFEQGISTSISSLDKMKQSLKLDESAKSLSNLEKAGRSFSLAGVGNSVAAIGNKFTAMEVVAITALQNITNSALNYGKQIMSALTIQPIKTGFEEYETQIGAIQTILANTSSKGKTLEDVNSALDELNHYADMTIYNFTEMTRNIGTFTAAGVDLDKSVGSIKGIANLAAISGSTSQQASTAMYQLSQALASGTVKLMDWNSVVNAGMGGQVFQDALKRTASVMGVVGEEANEMLRKLQNGEVSFRDSLSSGWLNADILTQTLMQFTGDLSEAELIALGYTQEQAREIIEMGEMAKSAATEVKTFSQLFDTLKEAAQSGWTQSWELIIGDFEEAKALLTGFSDYFSNIINQSAESRNAVLAEWKELGGRNLLFGDNGIVWNLIHSIENVVKTFSTAFDEFFPPTTGKQLVNITKAIANFTEKIKAFTENSEKMGKLSRGFRGIAAAFKMVTKVANGFWRVAKRIGELLGPHLLDAFGKVGDWVVSMNESFDDTAFFNGIIECIEMLYDIAVEMIPQIIDYMEDLFDSFEKSDFYKNTLLPAITGIKNFFTNLKQRLSDFDKLDVNGLADIWGKITIVFDAIVEAFKTLKAKIEPYIKDLDLGALSTFILTLLGIILAFKLYKGISSAQSIITSISDTLDTIGSSLGDLGKKLTSSNWFVRSQSILLLAGSVWLIGDTFNKLAQLDWEGVGKGAAGMFGTVASLVVASKTVGSVGFTTGLGLIGLSVSIKIMASTLSDLSTLSWEEIGKGISGLTGIMVELLAFVKLATTDPNLKSFSAMKLIGLGAAVLLFSQCLVSLSALSFDSMLVGIGSLTVIMGELIAFVKLANNDPNLKSFSAIKLVILGYAVSMFGETLATLGTMNWDQAKVGISAMTAIMLELLAFVKLGTTKEGTNLADVGMLFTLGDAVKNMGEALKSLGEMSWEQVKVGVTSLTAIMIELIAFIKLATVNKDVQSFSGIKLMLLGVSVLIFAQSLSQLSTISWDGLKVAITAMTAVMTELIVFVKLATTDPNLKSFSGMKLIGLGASVWIFAQALTQLSTLSWEGIGKSITAMTAVMAELIVFVRLATTDPNLKSFSGMKLIGLGASVWIFAQTLTQLSTLSWEGIGKGVTSLTFVMGELIAFVKLATTNPSVKSFSGIKLVLLAASVRIFANSLSVLGDMSWDGILKGVGMLTTIMGEVIAFTKLAQGVKFSSLLSIVPLFAGLAGMAVALNFVKDIDWEQMVAFGGGLSALMLSLSGALAILGALPVSAILKGSVGLIAASAALGVAINILAGLVGSAFTSFSEDVYQVGANIKGYSDLVANLDTDSINTSITVITSLGTAAAGLSLLDFSGATTFSSAITDIGSSMKLYAASIEGLTTEKSAEAKTLMDDASYIITKMSALAGSTVDMESLGTVFANIGSGLKLYSESLSSMNAPDQNGAGNGTYIKQAFDDLANNLPSSETIARISSYASGGGNDMTSFALGLTAIGTAIESFNTSIASLDTEQAGKATNFVSIMSSIQTGLTNSGGVLEFFTGKKQSLADFSVDIVTLGTAIGSFATSIDGIDHAKVTQATNAVSMLSAIQSGLEQEGGVFGFFTGKKDLATFGTKLNTLGAALKGFSDNVSGIDKTKMDNATAPIDALVTIQSKLDETGGVSQWFSGTQNLGSFGSSLVSFGKNFASFITSINGISIGDNMTDITDTIDTFAGFAERMSGLKDVYDLSDYIKWLGDDLKTFFTDVAGLDTSSHQTLSTFVNSIADAAVKLQGVEIDEWALTSLLTSLTLPELPDDAYAGLAEQVPAALDTIVTAITGKETDFATAGTTLGSALVTELVSAIQNGTETVETEASGLSNSGSTAANNTSGTWKATGNNLAIGMANGISAMAGRVKNAAVSAASGAIRAIRITWSVHSPSRVAKNLGKNFDLGLIGGIDGSAGLVFTSAERLGDGAVTTMQKSIQSVSDLIMNGIDDQPRIRPVLDMSDLTNGFRTIDGMFNTNRSIGGYFNGITSINSAHGMMLDQGRIIGTNDNRDVVDELHELGDRFNSLSEAVENMQVVLDSGELVGRTSSKMDRQLGVIAGRRERGN